MRFLVRFTIVLLVVDAVLLAGAGLLARQPWLLAGAGLALLLVAVVVAVGRRFRRRWEEVDAARRDLRAEVGTMANGLTRRGPGRPGQTSAP